MSSVVEKNSEQKVVRRSFLQMLGLLGLAISGLLDGFMNILFLKPEVSFGAPPIFTAGRPDEYKEGTSQVFEDQRVIVLKEKSGFMAVSLVCTHLGCTVAATDSGFDCPCHGSQFDNYGNVTGGPAPSPLVWYQVGVSPGGDIEINKGEKVDQGTFFNV